MIISEKRELKIFFISCANITFLKYLSFNDEQLDRLMHLVLKDYYDTQI